jgi:hypothetical protein
MSYYYDAEEYVKEALKGNPIVFEGNFTEAPVTVYFNLETLKFYIETKLGGNIVKAVGDIEKITETEINTTEKYIILDTENWEPKSKKESFDLSKDEIMFDDEYPLKRKI